VDVQADQGPERSDIRGKAVQKIVADGEGDERLEVAEVRRQHSDPVAVQEQEFQAGDVDVDGQGRDAIAAEIDPVQAGQLESIRQGFQLVSRKIEKGQGGQCFYRLGHGFDAVVAQGQAFQAVDAPLIVLAHEAAILGPFQVVGLEDGVHGQGIVRVHVRFRTERIAAVEAEDHEDAQGCRDGQGHQDVGGFHRGEGRAREGGGSLHG
jgi:hypothetical protein